MGTRGYLSILVGVVCALLILASLGAFFAAGEFGTVQIVLLAMGLSGLAALWITTLKRRA